MSEKKTKAVTYTLCSDEGNAWLQVPLEDLKALGEMGFIAGDSRMTDRYAYLEEDAGKDAESFIEKAKTAGWDVVISPQTRHEEKSTVRNFPKFDARFVNDPPQIGDELTIKYNNGDGTSHTTLARIIGEGTQQATNQTFFIIETATKKHRHSIDTRYAAMYMSMLKHRPQATPGTVPSA